MGAGKEEEISRGVEDVKRWRLSNELSPKQWNCRSRALYEGFSENSCMFCDIIPLCFQGYFAKIYTTFQCFSEVAFL